MRRDVIPAVSSGWKDASSKPPDESVPEDPDQMLKLQALPGQNVSLRFVYSAKLSRVALEMDPG